MSECFGKGRDNIVLLYFCPLLCGTIYVGVLEYAMPCCLVPAISLIFYLFENM
jgi:hypothetical protein